MFLIKLASGLAMIIFGGRFPRKGLDRLFEGQLLAWLEKTTHNGAWVKQDGLLLSSC